MSSQFEIIAIIGSELFNRLAYRKGGERIYIHANQTHDSELSRIIGFDAAKSLSAHMGNSLVHISRSVKIKDRNRQITAMRLAGIPAEECGRIFGLKARTVRGIAQGVDDERPCWGSSARRMRWWLQSGAQQNFNFT